MEYVDYGVWDGHDSDRSWSKVVDQFLEESRGHQKERLIAELDRIDSQLAKRDTIHAEIVAELEWKIDRYTDRLERLYRTRTGGQDGERDRVKDRIATFQQELREAHRNRWQDRQTLERERRDLLRELAEVEDETVSELL